MGHRMCTTHRQVGFLGCCGLGMQLLQHMQPTGHMRTAGTARTSGATCKDCHIQDFSHRSIEIHVLLKSLVIGTHLDVATFACGSFGACNPRGTYAPLGKHAPAELHPKAATYTRNLNMHPKAATYTGFPVTAWVPREPKNTKTQLPVALNEPIRPLINRK
jgi:hypothetical protein